MKKKNNVSEIHELPVEKMLKRGSDALTDSELIAIILQTGTKTCSVFELSDKVLELSEQYGRGMLGLYSVPAEKLCGIPGVGCFKSCRLKAVAEIAKRIHETDAFSRISYDSPSSIADAYMEKMRHEPVEEVMLVMFDNKLHMIGEKCISRGTVNSAIASPREIFIYALEHHAVHIVLIHNHPSGDTTPSENDVEMTERVRNTGNIIGISLLDHIIIGDRRYTSFKEKGFLH
ncbi:MAG: DNA repair protein RadC [Lachnospiraceae bacterium]|jgi:DNA repair protein RadC|nr:DNA repair protein RadC [Lachnospiraceae bacterium]